jgi:hypothetical protein
MSHDTSQSKDDYFQRIAEISDEMIAAHGRDFAIGTLVLAARFVAGHAVPSPTGENAGAESPRDVIASQDRASEERP